MNRKLSYICCISALALILNACKKDEPDQPTNPGLTSSGTGVFVINEGNFNGGNAKLSYYDIGTGKVTEDVYQKANGVALGDICQSMSLHNNKAYVVVNNSSKIEVIDPVDYKQSATITGFTSPRFFLPVSKSKAYVTDLFSNSIQVVDLSSNTITKNISCGGHTEELALSYGKAFVTCPGKNLVYIINTSNDVMEDSIAVGVGPNSIKEDKNGKLWVLCNGNFSDTAGSLHRINPITRLVEKTMTFPSATTWPSKLDINGGNDTLYYLNTDVYRLSIADNALPTSAFISAGSRSLYGLGIDPIKGVVYVADAVDYSQKGKAYRYKSNGTLINSFPVGVIPGDFYFN